MPAPAAAVRPCSGVMLNGGTTRALPPPPSVGLAEADGPITAIVPPRRADSGSTEPEFFSSTVPASATRVATA